MFDTFGEFNSWEEINEAAAGLIEEGDLKNLKALAEENGLEQNVENYIENYMENKAQLCDPISAAIGKLYVEKREDENNIFVEDVVDYLLSNCDEIEFALQIRKTGKRIKKAGERIVAEAKKNTVNIGGRKGNYCGPMKGYQLIREYYQEG